MKLTSDKALEILEKYRGKTESDMWIEHCICVGNTAGKIAQALNEKSCNVDVDKTITLGYIHDIGKYIGKSHGHVMRGYNYIKGLGYDEEYANICLTHSYLNNDIICTAGGVPDANENQFLLLRHGVYAKTHYHIKETYKLKEYFDKLLGHNLYDLFPEIKENL